MIDDWISYFIKYKRKEERCWFKLQSIGSSIRRQTVTDSVFEDLRQQIINGRLAPGTRLKHAELAMQLDISQTPIREALNRLGSVGLADYSPRRGWYVHEITYGEAKQLYEVREYIEGLIARRLAGHPSGLDLKELESILKRYDICLQRRNINGCVAADLEFHKQMALQAQNAYAIEITERIFDRVYALRRLDTDLESLREAVGEHQRIVEAIANGNQEEAEAVARKHIRGCIDGFLQRFFDKK